MTEVRWARLRPDEFVARQRDCPIVYLPFGLCEPHGHIAPFGLDTLKADYYCDEAARRFGGIVAPTQGYHIHETGFHRPWLDEVVGDHNPYLGGMPPEAVCHHLLYQLRAFANAGFRAIVGISGHSGGSQEDLRLVGDSFSERHGIPVVIHSDPEWVEDLYQGDHAGAYEISQLLAIEPDLLDLSLIDRGAEPGSGGRLALGEDASEATRERGEAINEAILRAVGERVRDLRLPDEPAPFIEEGEMEELWETVKRDPRAWHSRSGE